MRYFDSPDRIFFRRRVTTPDRNYDAWLDFGFTSVSLPHLPRHGAKHCG